MNKLSDFKNIYCIGIGGIGVSALAKYARHLGIKVSGSDAVDSELIEDLRSQYQIPISIGVREDALPEDCDAVIYSPAISKQHLEYQEAFNKGIPLFSYPEMLGTLTHDTTSIAISGTNGKTTTSAMVVEVMKYLGMDPTAIVGAILQKYNSNFIPGSSEYLVLEACEYKGSFLKLSHDILVITNVTEDHLDYFKDLHHIQKTFEDFLANKKGPGVLVCNSDLPNLAAIVAHAQALGMKIIPYQKFFNLDLSLPIPGDHNKQNFAAALGVIEALDASVPEAREYLSKYFQGAKRRMEFVGLTENGVQIFDDYAHNPEGLAYLIKGLRDFYPEKKIILLFEPHLYSRTRDFKQAFADELSKVDVLYLFPTYRAREEHIPEEDFLLKDLIRTENTIVHTVRAPEQFKESFLAENYDKNFLIITAGAGTVWKHGLSLKKSLRRE